MSLKISRRVFCHLAKGSHQRKKLTLRFMTSQEEHIIKSPFPDLPIPRIPLHELLWARLDQWKNRIAIECSVTGKRFTYGEGRSLSKRIASILQNNFALQKGECFALICPNMPEYPFFVTAASEAGLVATTVNSGYTADEIAKQLQDAEAKVAVTIPSKYTVVKDAIRKAGFDIPIIVIKDNEHEDIPRGGISLARLLSEATEEVKPVPINIQDNILLQYSSGTTGLSKGVQLTHYNAVSHTAQLMTPGTRMMLPSTETQQDVVLSILPLYHIYGLMMGCLGPLAEGGKIITFPKFEPKQFLSGIVKHEIQLFYLVPPLMLFLADHPSVTTNHLRYVRETVVGAAPVGEADIKRYMKKTPNGIFRQGYGMTEVCALATITIKGKRKEGSTGVPCANFRMKIVDVQTGKNLPPGKTGELYMQSPQVMKGYLKNEEANADIFRDGWMRTGDLAYYDDEGDIYVVDRLKELIKVKGLQVAPAELEAILREHPDILESGVIGVPDARAGEVPRAFVVKAANSNLTEQDVMNFVASKVSEHKKLTGGVVFIDVMPKSLSGKLLRRELRNL